MTSQKDQIQRLITEIEATLAKPTARLPLGLSGEAERQRQLLGKLFSYLQSLDQMFDSPGGWGPVDPGTGQFVSPQTPTPDMEESASQVLQGLLQEMSYLRENSLKPMRQELESLQQRRDSLQAEVNILEAQRSSDPLQSEQQIADFLQTLMQRLQEQLSAEMVQNFAAMETAAVEKLAAADNPVPLLSGQRLEQVRLLQAQSDQLLLKLDSTLTAVFDSLQKSVDSYRESLEEGLDQMHGLGRQGEVIFHAFINHLAQQLGQDASSYLTGDVGTAIRQAALQGPEAAEVDVGTVQRDELDQALDDLSLDADVGMDEADPVLDIDSDLALLEDAIAPADLDEDITLIQSTEDTPDVDTDVDTELALLEEAISADDLDGDITLIQTDGDLVSELDTEFDADDEITQIQIDDALLDIDSELAQLEDAIAPIDLGPASDDDSSEGISSEAQTDLDVAAEEADAAATPEELSASFDLDSALGVIDESMGLLAIGADEGEILDPSQLDDPSPDALPQIESEGELFNLDTDLGDLGLDDQTDEDPATDPADVANEVLFFENDETSSRFDPDAIPLIETDPLDPDQVVDNWLFDRGPVESVVPSAQMVEEDAAPVTVETLFGDSLAAPDDAPDDAPDVGDTVSSLSELLPDEQTLTSSEDFPENVPDDVYIAASADEDLINLVESPTEQRLLIDFDDEQLVEQLDEDLQKLAGETLSTDYGVDEDDALEPLDQNTLETIVNDLDLEDLNLDDESGAESEIQAPYTDGASTDSGEAVGQPDDDIEGLDLFGGFGTDVTDVDNPSGEDDIEIPAVASESPSEAGNISQELDLLGLADDPLDMDDFDDGLPDSLADELGGWSERSDALSQEPTDDFVGQLLSDLEEPVTDEAEALAVPEVDDTEPRLDSASTPDLPSDSPLEVPDLGPEADDFLQAEQAAFWQTVADDEPTSSIDDLLFEDDGSAEEIEEAKETDESSDNNLSLDAVSEDLADDFDDLLLLDDLPDNEADEDEELDLGDLDDLFGQPSLPDLEALAPPEPVQSDVESSDPLAELELDAAVDPEGVSLDASDDTDDDTEEVFLSEAPDAELLLSEEPEALLPEAPNDIEALLPETPDDIEALLPEVTQTDEAQVPDDGLELSSALPVPPDTAPQIVQDIDGDWFLGLDVGATGLSAVLMNRQTGQVYPLYWQKGTEDAKHFRLPAVAVVTSAQETVAVGYEALGDLGDLANISATATPSLVNINRLKPLLKVAVGHGQTLSASDPWLRWSDTVELPMLQVLQAMVALLKHLVEQGQAVGLETQSLAQVWQNLQGVVVGYPTNWPDTYSFNLREAVLAAGLIEQPGQILFVEDAIATILSGLPDPNDVSISETVPLSRQSSLYNCQWQEGTVVISGGAVMTELGLVHLPKDLANLNYADFALRGFAYAGDALDQDIVCQLLLPEERRQPVSEADANTRWDWQGHLAAADADWNQLRLNELTLPNVGHVDWAQRYTLQQRLLSSNLGQSLLAAARHLKIALQQQNHIQITLAGQRWLIKRRHLENLIFLPYIQRINRYLNVLLSHHSVDAQSIKQVVCTGGSASLPAIARWLRQKFPNATIIQDTYASELPQSCSRVAYGLVNLARYGQVLNVTRQQYSDYFLLMELLRVFPQQPLPVGAIMHLLEQRGINTQACHLHILALLEGHLPPGLVPTAADRGLICDRTADLPTYRTLLQTPLFSKTVTETGGQIYIPNEAQAEQLRAYINRLLLGKAQSLEEPLIAQFEVFA